MKKIFFTNLMLALILSSCNEVASLDPSNSDDLTLETIAYVHNSVLPQLLSSRTKSTTIQNLRSYEHAQLVSQLACDAASKIGIDVAPSEIIDFVRTEQIKIFDIFDAEKSMTPLIYIDKLPYDELVKSKIKQLYIKDLTEGSSALEEYLFQLANITSKAYDGCSQYSYSSLYNFYSSDAMFWNNYLATKGEEEEEDDDEEEVRHAVAAATDVFVGAALSGVTGFWGSVAAGAVAALASQAIEKGEINPDSTTD